MTPAPTDLDAPSPLAPAGEAGDAEITARPPAVPGSLLAVRRPFDTIEPATWDALAAASPWATPFARWGVHRAWWDAYGANAHEQTLVVVDPAAPDPDAPVAIVPLMHRHEVEPDDAILRTHLRPDPHLPQTAVRADGEGRLLRGQLPRRLRHAPRPPGRPAGGRGRRGRALATPADAADPDHPDPWDVVDLRRLRSGDPAADALFDAFGARIGAGLDGGPASTRRSARS